jgi:serine/threonine-protein kinase
MRLGPRIFAATAGIIVVTLGVTVAAAWAGASRAADRAVEQGLVRTRALVDVLLAGRERQLRGSATVFAQNPTMVARSQSQSTADWYDRAIEAKEQADATWAQITDSTGMLLARSDDPQAEPEPLAESALVGRALEGTVTSGYGVTGDTVLFQAVSVPVGTPGTPPVGTLQVALAVDSALAWRVRGATSSEIVLYALDREDRPHIVAATVPVTAALQSLIAQPAADSATADTTHLRLAGPDGEPLVGQRGTLRTAGGSPIGGFVVLRSRRAELAAFSALWTAIAVSGALGLLLATALAGFVARRIARPVQALAAATRRAADGDYDAPIPEAAGEVGTLADAVRTMLADLRDKAALVAALGDAERTMRVTTGGVMEGGAASGTAVPVTLPRGSGTPGSAASAEPRVGQLFAGRYEIIGLLGAGGMGTVYKARDRELGELVAVKTLKREAAADDPSMLERFRDEIRLARRITHRSVVRTHDVGQSGGIRYITMEYVDGTSLAELIASRGRLAPAVTVSIGKQLARALEAAHEQGVLHRDVKPQNLIVTGDGLLKVMDFGIARLAGGAKGVTQSGVIVGTPAYMAPEQLGSEALDARADVYAAGVVLYECLTGQAPFRGGSAYEIIASVLADDAPPPHAVRPGVPESLSAVVMQAMAKSRDARLASAGALHAALERVEGEVRRGEPKYPEPGMKAGVR